MTDLTNAPPLPDEPLSLQMWRNSTIVLGGREHEMFQYIDKLRAQLEQSPMRESAIIKGLDRQLADARQQFAKFHDADCPHKNEVLVGNCCQGNDVALNAMEWMRKAERETARADAREKDAKRYKFLRGFSSDGFRVIQDYPEGGDAHLMNEQLDAAVDAALGAPT